MANGLMGLQDLLGGSSNATSGLFGGQSVFTRAPSRNQQRSRLLTGLISNAGSDPYSRLGAAFGGLIGMGARAGAEGLGIVDEPEEVKRNRAIREVQQTVSQRGLDPLDPGFGEFVAEEFQRKGFGDLATRSLLQARAIQSQFAPEPTKRALNVIGGTPEAEQIRQQFGITVPQGESYELEITGNNVTNISRLGETSTTEITNVLGGEDLTPGQKKVDELFAQEYVDWTTGGGADTVGRIAQISSVLERLESGENLTGPLLAAAPDFLLAVTNPDALDARQNIEEVVQRNLREVLGAQFTEREGERLIARAFDPALPAEQNASRLRRLFLQMQSAAEAKNEQAAYFERNGTLRGYEGERPTIGDFYGAIEGLSVGQETVIDGKTWRYIGGQPDLESSWELVE